jgi:hypothetical protein
METAANAVLPMKTKRNTSLAMKSGRLGAVLCVPVVLFT